MKTIVSNAKQVSRISLFLLLFLVYNLAVYAQKYYLTFQEFFDTATVEQVTVENRTQGTSLSLPGDKTLVLKMGDVVIKEIEKHAAQKLLIYPNPSHGSSLMQFTLPEDGSVTFALYDMTGKRHKQVSMQLEQGVHTFNLPAMSTGVYLVSIRSDEYTCFGKWVSCVSSQNSSDNISLVNSMELPVEETYKTAKATTEEYEMNYTENDLLCITGQSGNNRTIVMLRPNQSQLVTFRFIECKDGSENYYPIVEIGGKFWMAEDLNSDKAIDGVLLNRAGSASEWDSAGDTGRMIVYNSFDTLDIYGTYYNYVAAINSVPDGWHLPSKEEYEEMLTAIAKENDAQTVLTLLKDGDSSVTLWSDVPASDLMNETGFGMMGNGYFNGNTLVKQGIAVAYWTTTESSQGYVYTPYLTKNGFTFTSSPKRNGFKIRAVAENIESGSTLQTLKNVFGNLPTGIENDTKPVGATHVMHDNRKNLFVAGGFGNANCVLRVDDIAKATGNTTAAVSVPSVPVTGGVWCKNKLKKATSQLNESGRENLVIGVLNADMTDPWTKEFNSEVTVSLYIFNDSVNNYAPETVTLTGSFLPPSLKNYSLAETNSSSSNNARTVAAYWFFDIKACDVNGDFVDDIIVVCNSKIAIYDGKTYALIAWKDFRADFPEAVDNKKDFYTRIAIDDVNGDGKTDIVVVTSSAYTQQIPSLKSFPGKIHVFLGGDIQNETNHKTLSIPSLTQSGTTVNITTGDIDGDGIKEIVLNIQKPVLGTFTGANYLCFTKLDSSDSFTTLEYLMNGFSMANNASMNALTMAYLDGISQTPYIACGQKLFHRNMDGWTEVLDSAGKANILIANKDDYMLMADQVIASNFKKAPEGKEQLVYMFFDRAGADNEHYIYTYMLEMENSIPKLSKDMKVYSNSFDRRIYRPCNYEYPVISAVRSKHATRILEYKRYEYLYTQLMVDALLAAAPYQKDVMEPGSTFFGKSSSSGTQSETEYTTSASAIFGFEQEFSIPVIGVKAGGIDFSTKVSFGYTRGYSSSKTITKSTVFTVTDQDAVVVSMIPYHAYFYTIVKSENEKEVGNEIMMGFPDELRQTILHLETYTEMVRGDAQAPKLNTIFTHTIGNPATYPSSESSLSNMTGNERYCYTGNGWVQVSPGNTLISKSIEISQEDAKSEAMSVDMEVELVVNTGGVKFGADFGFGTTNKVTKTIGENTSMGGEVKSPLSGVTGFNPFSWNITMYNYKVNETIFSVVNFLVK